VRITAQVLDQILRQRLTERLREELGATYSPLVQVQLVEDPDPSIEVLFQVSTDPEGLEAVAAALFADLADLRAEGPTADELAIAQEQLVRNYELFSNEQLLQDLAFLLLHPGVDPGDLLVRIDRARSVTAGDVEELAAALLADDRYIEVRLVPAG
jgi:zinc protease